MTPESESVRAFIALPVPDEIRRRLAEFQRGWQGGLPGSFIRWTPVEQMHLTLRFLGDITPDTVPALEAALHHACEGVASFDLTATGCGCFPDARKPRVLWVGVAGDTDALAQLQWRIADETRAWGEIEPREFRAHLTLGRVKDPPGSVAREIARRAQSVGCGQLGYWHVSEVQLMQSELSPTGAKHTLLVTVPLCG